MTTKQLTQERIFETRHEAAQIVAAQFNAARTSPGFENEVAEISLALDSGVWAVRVVGAEDAHLIGVTGEWLASMTVYARRDGGMGCIVVNLADGFPFSEAALAECMDRRAAAKRQGAN